jgi:hypothetical protein
MCKFIFWRLQMFAIFRLDLCFLTQGNLFLSADYKWGTVFLHVPSPSKGQEEQQNRGKVIYITEPSPTMKHKLLLFISLVFHAHWIKINII